MKKRLSDKEMIRGALGGWIAHNEPRLVTTPSHSADGAFEFVVRIKIPAEAANKAREEYAAREGGWKGTP